MSRPHANWSVPVHTVSQFRERASRYCVCVPVINEGDRILNQLRAMRRIDGMPDVILADGGSDDGSTEPERLRSLGVSTLLVKQGAGRLSAQLRMAFAYALEAGYEGVVTVDGNDKDDVGGVGRFVSALDDGYDFVQGSRFLPGGGHENTPLARYLAIRLVHVPVISAMAGFRYTDTTNAFRAHSRQLLLHPEVQIFRDVFDGYELLAYLPVRAAELGMRVGEVPVRRVYPRTGRTPTKISPIEGNLELLRVLWRLWRGEFEPPSNVPEGDQSSSPTSST